MQTNPSDTGPPPSALDHLRAAAAQFRDEVAAIDATLNRLTTERDIKLAQLADLSQMIQTLAGLERATTSSDFASVDATFRWNQVASKFNAQLGTRSAGQAPDSAREAVLQVLASEPREFEAHEIVDRVRALIEVDPATVRSLLSKMAAQKQIAKARRGVYKQVPLAGHLVRRANEAALTEGMTREQLHDLIEQGEVGPAARVSSNDGWTQQQLHDAIEQGESLPLTLSGSVVHKTAVSKPTVEEFLAQTSDPNDEKEYDPEHGPELSSDDYAQMHHDQKQAHREWEADQEETSD